MPALAMNRVISVQRGVIHGCPMMKRTATIAPSHPHLETSERRGETLLSWLPFHPDGTLRWSPGAPSRIKRGVLRLLHCC